MDFISLFEECAPWVAPQTIAAIVKTESNFQPLAIGVNGTPRLSHKPRNKTEAILTAKYLIHKGRNIDLGLGQINSKNLSKYNLSIEGAFDPCQNIAISAKILHSNYQAAQKLNTLSDQAVLHAALSAYNTGSFTKGLKNGYVQKVINNAEALKNHPSIPAIALNARITDQYLIKYDLKAKERNREHAIKLKLEKTSISTTSKASVNVYDNKANSAMVY